MANDDRPQQGFEEQAALREIEQLQRELEESRRRRRQANDEFDRFIRTFTTREQPRAAEEPQAPAAIPQGPQAPTAGAAQSQPIARQPTIPAGLAITTPPNRKGLQRFIVLALVVAGAVFVTRWLITSIEAPGAPEPAAAVPAPSPAPSPAAAAPEPVPIAELRTTRAVWVRVLVDGERTIERELPANARVPLAPTERVVIRAGDAGALHVFLGGKDQGPLGRDGMAVTRNFVVSR
jgi:hypothetical protein